MACVRAGRTWVPKKSLPNSSRRHERASHPRELAVLRLVAAGHSNREIGDLLGTSDGTVKIHLTHLFAKLDVTSRAEAIATALRRGLVRID